MDDKYLRVSFRQILGYAEGKGLQRDQIKEEMKSVIDNIANIRYIRLIQRK